MCKTERELTTSQLPTMRPPRPTSEVARPLWTTSVDVPRAKSGSRVASVEARAAATTPKKWCVPQAAMDHHQDLASADVEASEVASIVAAEAVSEDVVDTTEVAAAMMGDEVAGTAAAGAV